MCECSIVQQVVHHGDVTLSRHNPINLCTHLTTPHHTSVNKTHHTSPHLTTPPPTCRVFAKTKSKMLRTMDGSVGQEGSTREGGHECIGDMKHDWCGEGECWHVDIALVGVAISSVGHNWTSGVLHHTDHNIACHAIAIITITTPTPRSPHHHPPHSPHCFCCVTH